MIHEAMLARKVSYRDLAAATNQTAAPVAYSTAYNWVHSKSGVPNPSAYTREVNAAIARCLSLRPERLAAAAEESMPLFNHDASPRPVEPTDGLEELKSMILPTRSRYIRTSRLVKLIDALIDKRSPAPLD